MKTSASIQEDGDPALEDDEHPRDGIALGCQDVAGVQLPHGSVRDQPGAFLREAAPSVRCSARRSTRWPRSDSASPYGLWSPDASDCTRRHCRALRAKAISALCRRRSRLRTAQSAFRPMSDASAQPVAGARPPDVFTRWMAVVCDSRSPDVGPVCLPTVRSRNHGMALGSTYAASVDIAARAAHTLLLSRECSHVARGSPASSGFALRKCVISCPPSSENSVA